MSVVAVICARNEEKYLQNTLLALQKQSKPVDSIILVDDGSVDKTSEIALNMGCLVVSSPYHENSYVGKPDLAKVWNLGLAKARKLNPDFILCQGADHVLPSRYIEDLLLRMRSDSKLVLCSGMIEGEPCDRDAPRGSGRLVKANFWYHLNHMVFPICFGWESWLIYKAQELGFKATCFNDITSVIARPTQLTTTPSRSKANLLIPQMYAMGYPWIYILGKCLLIFLTYPRLLFSVLRGLSQLSSVEKWNNADFLHEVKTKELVRKIIAKLA